MAVRKTLALAGLLAALGVSAINMRQNGVAQQSPAQDPLQAQNHSSSFISVNGLLCVEAPARVAEGALALKKAGVMGELYNGVIAHAGVSCAELNYRVSAGEDSCYPGAQTFVRQPSDIIRMGRAELATRELYQQNWNLNHETVALMAACTCHPDSQAMAARQGTCGSISQQGSWVHRDPFHNDDHLMCDGGPFQQATYVMAILKSTGQLPMHRFDQIAPVSCSDLGYHYSVEVDHCFPKLHMTWSVEDQAQDAGLVRSSVVEPALFNGAFEYGFERIYGMDNSVMNLKPGCHCLPNSEVGVALRGQCNPTHHHTSPIRDWFHGQDVGFSEEEARASRERLRNACKGKSCRLGLVLGGIP
jgi:hypothetical protein